MWKIARRDGDCKGLRHDDYDDGLVYFFRCDFRRWNLIERVYFDAEIEQTGFCMGHLCFESNEL